MRNPLMDVDLDGRLRHFGLSRNLEACVRFAPARLRTSRAERGAARRADIRPLFFCAISRLADLRRMGLAP
jgi:hypothetical protein